jgi:hypothetical protein
MINANSNCSRVDAVKAAANQLELLSGATGSSPTAPTSSAARKVKSDLLTLDDQIRTGDAKKAELALAVTKKDVQASETAPDPKSTVGDPRALDAYA